MRLGNVMAALAFVLWGILPLYYQFLPQAAMDELLALRIVASVPLCALIIVLVSKKRPQLLSMLAQKRALFYTFIGSLLMCMSWSAFTWAITNNRVMDASLGFFISPLTLAALGVIVLRDRISLGKTIALMLGGSGILYLTLSYGQVPYIALVMAISFTLYSWCKKKSGYNWSTSLFVEVLILLPIAVGYLLFKEITVGCESFHNGWDTLALYLGSGPTTIAPLLFYSLAVSWTRMSNIGLMQYIEPSLQFLIATYLFGETFSDIKIVSFGLIWIGLLFIITEQLIARYPLLQAVTISNAWMQNASSSPTVAMMKKGYKSL